MEVDRLYLDANILIMLGEGSGGVVDLLTEMVERRPAEHSFFLCTSELSLAELLVNQYEQWLVTGSFMEVCSVHRDVLRCAAVLRSTFGKLKLPDAIHLATAVDFGCSHFLSADTRLPDHVELVHKSVARASPSATLTVIRPEAATLRSIIRSLA